MYLSSDGSEIQTILLHCCFFFGFIDAVISRITSLESFMIELNVYGTKKEEGTKIQTDRAVLRRIRDMVGPGIVLLK